MKTNIYLISLVLWEGEFDVYAWLELHLGDVQDLALTADELDDSLMDSHLVSVPRFTTFTTWRLSRSDSHASRWHRSWSLNLDAGTRFVGTSVDGLGSAHDLGACLVNGLDVLRADRDSDVVFVGGLGHLAFFLFSVRHVFVFDSWKFL